MIYFDTETIGFEGPIVLIQWAEDDGEIFLHNIWYSPISESLELIEKLCYHEQGVCGFNLAFDWFHICQSYTTLLMLADKVGHRELPIDHIDAYAKLEPHACFGPCLKPQTALDIMLHARKGPYQTTMDRHDIRIKRVPEVLAQALATELTNRIPLKDIYFEKQSDKKRRWTVHDIEDEEGRYIPHLKDVVLKFNPSSALKALAFDALGYEEDKILKFMDVGLGEKLRPNERSYAPFALAVGRPGKWNGAWPQVAKVHAQHWEYNDISRRYATDDVIYTRGLAMYFAALAAGYSEEAAREHAHGKQRLDNVSTCSISGDDDSILSCLVGAVRWRGYKINVDKIQILKSKAQAQVDAAKHNFNSTDVCRKYMEEVLNNEEKAVLQVNGKLTTKAAVLEEIQKWKMQDVCPHCEGMTCDKCTDGLITLEDTLHPAAERAKEILMFRRAGKRVELYNKLIRTGRFHPSLKVIGALSSRMSGGNDEQAMKGGSVNPQGIPREKEVRECFELADDGFINAGGDFDAFEVGLMDARYGDPDLREILLSGKKIHGVFGQFLFPGKSYEEISATKGLPGERDLYSRSKNGVFALAYGGEAHTLHNRVGISEEAAEQAYQRWIQTFKVWGEERQKIFDMFCSMRQPNGIGTKVEWHDPADYVESMFGFRRYFTLENQIVKSLFDLAEKPPPYIKDMKVKIVRRDREQTVGGAVRSALFAAAFAIQAANMRAAGNHTIQSSGAQLTKKLECRLWQIQPAGVTDWQIVPMNIHDEVMAPMRERHLRPAASLVDKFITEHKEYVPLIGMDWKDNFASWADK